MAETKFETIEPKILYFGTPVAVVSSLNEDGETNIAPMSSFWALGWTFLLGINEATKTADNLRRDPECVVNLPAPEMWRQVETLAPLTAKNPVPEIKAKSKYHYEPDKFQAAALTPVPSELVKPARVRECPIQMEARVRAIHQLGGERLQLIGGAIGAEIEILRVHAASDLIFEGHHINPAKWSPLIYNFRHYYRLAPDELGKTFRAEV